MPGLHFCGSRFDKVNKKFKIFVLEIVEPVLVARSYENWGDRKLFCFRPENIFAAHRIDSQNYFNLNANEL